MANCNVDSRQPSQHAARIKLASMSQLRSVGAQGDLEWDLPRIIFIGNQSAGKSSVVEAISGIKVPCDAETCTRCPLECQLSSCSSAWSCRISIRLEFDNAGRPRQEVSEHRFGNIITDKNEVEIALRRAQLAVLNPSVPFGDIMKMSPEDLNNGIPGSEPLFISRNVICVNIEGPDLTDLMFLDLPGIVQDADPDVVQLIEDMVVSRIRGNCLIMVVLSMTDDIDDQKALRLARQQDPEGRRTIGVLTKPDMLSRGSKVRDLWLDVIEGRKHQLHHGYYCTRQPDDDERSNNITPAEARCAEAIFFGSTVPWSTSTFKDRFGTENLVSTLSILLVQIINDRLPFIRQLANDRMEACRQELASLPNKIVGEPATHMLNLVTALCTEIQDYVDGYSNALIHERNLAFGAFKVGINNTQPRFVATVPNQAGTHAGSPTDNEPFTTATELIAMQKPVFLTDICSHIDKFITRELPGNIPFSSKKSLIAAFQSTWLKSAIDCFDSVKHAMLTLLMRCIDDKFGCYEILQIRMKSCITELAGKHYDSCWSLIMAMLEVEQMPFTMNDHYLQASTEKWLSRYKDERAGNDGSKKPSSKRPKSVEIQPTTPPANSLSVTSDPPRPVPDTFKRQTESFALGAQVTTDSDKVNSVLAQLAELGYSGLTPDDFEKLRQVDEFETEIAVMSEVRGYFQCAYKRVTDNIPSLIDCKFLRAIAQTLQQDLVSEFGLGSENANVVCANFFAEDPKLVAKREDLIAKRRMLETVQVQLHNFGVHWAAGQAQI